VVTSQNWKKKILDHDLSNIVHPLNLFWQRNTKHDLPSYLESGILYSATILYNNITDSGNSHRICFIFTIEK
jgi:hypothetical protein